MPVATAGSGPLSALLFGPEIGSFKTEKKTNLTLFYPKTSKSWLAYPKLAGSYIHAT